MRLTKIISLLCLGILASLISCDYETYAQGKRLYSTQCADCHGDQGEGLEKLIPPLAQTDYLVEHQRALACIIKKGIKGEIIVNGQMYNQVMEGINLTDVQITNIINYINHAWTNDHGEVSLSQIKTDLKNCN